MSGSSNGPFPTSAASTRQIAAPQEVGDNFAPIPVATPERLDFWKRFFATQKAW